MRAEKLIGGLGGEKDRWTQAADNLQSIYDTLMGDVLISAGVIAYLGPFTLAFRDTATLDWVKGCQVGSSAWFRGNWDISELFCACTSLREVNVLCAIML